MALLSCKSLFTMALALALSISLISHADAQTAGDTDDEVIRVDSSIVVVNATITDRAGKAVGGIAKKYFRVFEDGIEQEIETFAAEETPFSAVILLDTSGSMEERISLARSAAIEFLSGLRQTDSAAIFNFDSKIRLIQEFSNSHDLREQVFDLKADGMTALNDAVYKAAELLSKREEKRRAIVILSDGADNMSKRSSDKALKAALDVGATIYAVDMSTESVGDRDRMQSQAVLKRFAERSGGKFVASPGGVAMRSAFQEIVEELGEQYTIAYRPSNLKRDGKWRSIELRVARPNLTIRTRKGYNAPKAN